MHIVNFVTLVEGAQGAADKLGVDLQVTDATDDAVEAVKAGRMGGTVAQQPDLLGATAVENAVSLINGQSIEKSIPVEVALITAANAG